MRQLIINLLLTVSALAAGMASANPNDYNVLGVIASSQNTGGVALLKHKSSGKVAAYKAGQDISENFKIETVHQKTVTFSYQSKRYNLRVGDESPTELTGSASGDNIVSNLNSSGAIEKQGDTLRVSKALKENLAGENLNKVLMQAAALPHVENGRLVGFQLLEIDRGSIFDVAGFRNGDIITQINDQPINDAALAIKALNALKNASKATFGYLRNNTPMQLVVQID